MNLNIFLIGYRGTGKSTVGRSLARRLGWPFVDADELLEQRAGRTIRDIFATDGEPTFRDLESVVVAELATRTGIVAALGGGAVLRESNRSALGGRGLVVWLTAPAQVLYQRLHGDPTTGNRRPALTALDGLAEIEQLMAAREPIYRNCADLSFDTQARSPNEIAAEIAMQVESRTTEAKR